MMRYATLFLFLMFTSISMGQMSDSLLQRFVDSVMLSKSLGADSIELTKFKKTVKKIKLITYKDHSPHTYYKKPFYVKDAVLKDTVLKHKSKDELIDLVFSNDVGLTTGICYNPRNGILFMNGFGGVIGYVEICFECIRMRSLGKVPKLPQLSSHGFGKLQNEFKKYGQIGEP